MVGRVAATDGEGDELTYSIASTTAGAANFRMNSTTGVITLSRPIDREVANSQCMCREACLHRPTSGFWWTGFAVW